MPFRPYCVLHTAGHPPYICNFWNAFGLWLADHSAEVGLRNFWIVPGTLDPDED